MAKILKRLRSGGKESLKTRLQELENKLQVQDEWYSRLEKKNKELYEENMILKREKDELLRRLSQSAGDQFKKDNPGIADLNDQTRPSKIEEKWSSLYKEEWVDAYEELRHDTQRHIPRTIEKQLLDIVMLCYKRCHEIAEEQMKKARISMNGFEHYVMDDSPLEKNRNLVSPSFLPRTTRMGEMFIDEIISHYKERRKHDTDWVKAVQKKLVNLVSQKGIQLPHVLAFTEKCAELCWFMWVQDPPIVIDNENIEGKPVDRSKYNLYDRSGTITEYTVWPALLLHKNGPILAKGVVQAVQTFKPPPKYNPPEINTHVIENRFRVASKSVRSASPSKEQEIRTQSSRFPDKHHSSLKGDRISKSSGNTREFEKQGIIYYSNARANILLNDQMPPSGQTQYPFTYNFGKLKEITVHQSPRPRKSTFDEKVLIGRNKTSVVMHHSSKPEFSKTNHRPQKILVAHQTEV